MNLQKKFQPYYSSLHELIQSENWHGALIVAVTLPDICCTLDGTKKNNNSKASYIKWFDKYIDDYILTWYSKEGPAKTAVLCGKNAYALRCEVLHQGSSEIYKQKKSYDATIGYEKILFGLTDNAELIYSYGYDDEYLYLNVKTYCSNILRGLNVWLKEYENHSETNLKANSLIELIKL